MIRKKNEKQGRETPEICRGLNIGKQKFLRQVKQGVTHIITLKDEKTSMTSFISQ